MRALVLLLAAAAAALLLAAPAEARPGGDGPKRANQRLHLHHSRLGRANLRRDGRGAPAGFDVAVDDATTLEVELDDDASAADLLVAVDKGKGAKPYKAAAASPDTPRVFRGRVKGHSNSRVSAVVQPDGTVQASVDVDGEEYFVAPLDAAENDGDGNDQVVFTRADMDVDKTKTCAAVHPDRRRSTDETPDFLVSTERLRVNDTEGTIRQRRALCTAAVCQVDIVVDADYEYYVSRGKSVDKVVADVTAIIDQVNVQYERDVGIHYKLTSVLVRTTAEDPYTSTDPMTMLSEMGSYWNTLSGSYNPPRDLVQLFTGKDLDGSTIGIAWLSAVCSKNYMYSVVQSDFAKTGLPYPHASDLSAHELGHNWGADHCNCANPAYTMNPYITLANRFDPATSIPQITNFRNKISCLEPYSAGPTTQAPTTQASTTTQATTTQATTTKASTTQATTTQAPAPAPVASCQSFGCGSYKAARACQCDASCSKYGDCCADINTCAASPTTQAPTATTASTTTTSTTTKASTTQATTTQASTTQAPAPAGSCQSFGCGTYKSSNKCQCDASCSKYGDCCSDFNSVCKR